MNLWWIVISFWLVENMSHIFIISNLSIRKPGSLSLINMQYVVFSTYRKMLILFFAVQTFKELMMSLNTYSNWNYSNVDIDEFSYFLLGWYQKFYGGEQARQHKASPNPSEVCTLGVDCGAARGRLESRKQSTPTPRKSVCSCVNLAEICLTNLGVKYSEGNCQKLKMEVLGKEQLSVKMQAEL